MSEQNNDITPWNARCSLVIHSFFHPISVSCKPNTGWESGIGLGIASEKAQSSLPS